MAAARTFIGAATSAAIPTRRTTEDSVVAALRDGILDGTLRPGGVLRADELALAYSVGPVQVRAALHRLADEGLVLEVAHHGWVVAPLPLDDVLALYVVRGQLESLTARLAAQRQPPGLVPRLEAVQQGMRRAAAEGATDQLVELNARFHREIRTAVDSAYLDRFLVQVDHAVRRLPDAAVEVVDRPQQVLAEHRAIIDAISGNDADAAGACVEEHIREARETCLRTLLG